MTLKDFCSKVDYSCLGWICDDATVQMFCDNALKYGFASVCVNPDRVAFCKERLGDKCGISAVVGFPCGATSADIKIAEAKEVIALGATDVDIVSNLSYIRDRKLDKAAEEYNRIVKEIRAFSPDTVIKFIVYSPYGAQHPCLTDEELQIVSDLVVASGADYIKFDSDAAAIKKMTGGKIKMKFAYCTDWDVAYDAVKKGCSRIGADEFIVPWIEEHRAEFD